MAVAINDEKALPFINSVPSRQNPSVTIRQNIFGKIFLLDVKQTASNKKPRK
jgi:hypothetical protein